MQSESDNASAEACLGHVCLRTHPWRITDDFPDELPVLPAESRILLSALPEDLLDELANGMSCAIMDGDVQERTGK